MRRFAGLFPGMIGACVLYPDDSPLESQSFNTIFFRFIWEKTKKDIVLCCQKITLSNGVMAAQQILVLFVQVRILVGQL